MFTGLSTAAGPIVHIGASSGACLIAGFVGTSTGQRDTAARKTRGDLGNQANRPGSPTWRFGRSSDRNGRQAGSRLRPFPIFGSDRTGNRIGIDGRRGPQGLRNAGDQERDRIQPTAAGVRPADAQARVRPDRPSPNPDLARGRGKPVRRGSSSPRSISAILNSHPAAPAPGSGPSRPSPDPSPAPTFAARRTAARRRRRPWSAGRAWRFRRR